MLNTNKMKKTRNDITFHPPICEIITIGSELLLGQIDDTNTTYLARELSRIGVAVRFRIAAGDRPEDMENVIRQVTDLLSNHH